MAFPETRDDSFEPPLNEIRLIDVVPHHRTAALVVEHSLIGLLGSGLPAFEFEADIRVGLLCRRRPEEAGGIGRFADGQ
jgi:hypothetical protein